MLDKQGLQAHYRKGTKAMFIQAFDGKKYCCVNDAHVYALECIPEHEAKSKDLDFDYKELKPEKQHVPPMNTLGENPSFISSFENKTIIGMTKKEDLHNNRNGIVVKRTVE